MNEEELDMRTDAFCQGNFFYGTVSLDETCFVFLCMLSQASEMQLKDLLDRVGAESDVTDLKTV